MHGESVPRYGRTVDLLGVSRHIHYLIHQPLDAGCTAVCSEAGCRGRASCVADAGVRPIQAAELTRLSRVLALLESGRRSAGRTQKWQNLTVTLTCPFCGHAAIRRDAAGPLRLLLRLQRVRRCVEIQAGRLLRLLFVWRQAVPVHSRGLPVSRQHCEVSLRWANRFRSRRTARFAARRWSRSHRGGSGRARWARSDRKSLLQGGGLQACKRGFCRRCERFVNAVLPVFRLLASASATTSARRCRRQGEVHGHVHSHRNGLTIHHCRREVPVANCAQRFIIQQRYRLNNLCVSHVAGCVDDDLRYDNAFDTRRLCFGRKMRHIVARWRRHRTTDRIDAIGVRFTGIARRLLWSVLLVQRGDTSRKELRQHSVGLNGNPVVCAAHPPASLRLRRWTLLSS